MTRLPVLALSLVLAVPGIASAAAPWQPVTTLVDRPSCDDTTGPHGLGVERTGRAFIWTWRCRATGTNLEWRARTSGGGFRLRAVTGLQAPGRDALVQRVFPIPGGRLQVLGNGAPGFDDHWSAIRTGSRWSTPQVIPVPAGARLFFDYHLSLGPSRNGTYAALLDRDGALSFMVLRNGRWGPERPLPINHRSDLVWFARLNDAGDFAITWSTREGDGYANRITVAYVGGALRTEQRVGGDFPYVSDTGLVATSGNRFDVIPPDGPAVQDSLPVPTDRAVTASDMAVSPDGTVAVAVRTASGAQYAPADGSVLVYRRAPSGTWTVPMRIADPAPGGVTLDAGPLGSLIAYTSRSSGDRVAAYDIPLRGSKIRRTVVWRGPRRPGTTYQVERSATDETGDTVVTVARVFTFDDGEGRELERRVFAGSVRWNTATKPEITRLSATSTGIRVRLSRAGRIRVDVIPPGTTRPRTVLFVAAPVGVNDIAIPLTANERVRIDTGHRISSRGIAVARVPSP